MTGLKSHLKQLTKEQYGELLHISRLLNASVFEQALMEQALDWIIANVNADRGLCARYRQETDAFSIIAARNIGGETIDDLAKFSSGVLRTTVREKKPLIFHDAQHDPSISQFQSVQRQQIKSVIGVPILQRDTAWGAIVVDSISNRKEFTEENLLFLDFFSNLLSLAFEKIRSLESLRDENRRLRNELETAGRIPEMIGTSPPMQALAKTIQKVAATDTTVLLLGESGTGKDLVARMIHALSARGTKSFVAQFCGAIPDTLLESELFGYKKGAFTGATTDKKGLFEVAQGGTFFLDEIADISIALQTKLLRILENREFTRLGDTNVQQTDVRIIAATNRDIMQLVKEKLFREDLYYRLYVFPITIPPLRDRREDISLLAHHFISAHTGKSITLTPKAIRKLEGYSWPGNVRQLFNVVQRALILCEGSKLMPEHIVLGDEDVPWDAESTLEQIERRILQKRLEDFKGNRALAAQSLGVSVRWVYSKLKEMEGE